jgi:long-chain acyl-CoA synthetase
VESLETFTQNLQQTQPTIFFGVPRIWVKLMQGVQQKLGGAKVSSALMNLPLIGNLLKQKIIKGLGLDKVRHAISAAAAISPEVLLWYKELGVEIIEVYGLSETTGVSHANIPGEVKIGTVGKAIPETECKLTESGEILIRSPHLMEGYYKQPDITDLAIQDGWFRTGDLGKVDSEGFLTITGRVKEIFKTAKGKYISPAPIEAKVQPAIEVEQMIVTGVDLPQPIVIAVMLDPSSWNNKKSVKKKLIRTLKTVNDTLEKHEKLSHLILVKDEWTVDNGMMTPTLKLRRQQIENFYLPKLQSLNKNKPIIWLD